jgi:AcrR family transcriptional regulator
MPRPSQNLDLAMLKAGRELFPNAGCAGLSVRAVADRSGANPGMFHYHFRTKDQFLRTLLQQVYDEMFEGLADAAALDGAPLERLRAGLVTAAGLLRIHRRVFARVWMDAMAGEPVAAEFLRANAPRHIGLLARLVEQAQAAGGLRELPPFQCVAILLGAVALPVVFASGLVETAMPAAVQRQFQTQVMDDEAIAQRVDLVLRALRRPAAPRARGSVGRVRRKEVS